MLKIQGLTSKDLVDIAKKTVENGANKNATIVAVLVTTAQYVDGKEKIISQAIIPYSEVNL